MTLTNTQEATGSGSVPPVWLVRAGARGEDEAVALEQGKAIIGFNDIPDLTPSTDRDSVVALVRRTNPEAPEARNLNRAAQLVAFTLRMREGDIVVLPLKTRPGQVALGQIKGPYTYQEVEGTKRHTRLVEWIRTDVPRSDFNQDLLYSLGALMTVCRIQRNDAGRRITAILNGESDPGSDTTDKSSVAAISDEQTVSEDRAILNIEDTAHQQILDHIQARFPGHDLARLVDAVLQAGGYSTRLSPPGPDGGVDILAGRGSIVFEGPRICVQVKATTRAIDVTILRNLQGTMQTFQANQGILVSWGGFTGPLHREARQSFFTVRLWNADDLIRAVYRTYERLPKQIQADIPLERIWTLVHDDSAL